MTHKLRKYISRTENIQNKGTKTKTHAKNQIQMKLCLISNSSKSTILEVYNNGQLLKWNI